MKRLFVLALPVVVALVAVDFPVAAADREHQQIMADIRMLQEQTQQLQMLLGRLGEALETVTAKLDEQANVNRKAFADQRLLADNLASGVRIVREKVDDTNVRLSSLSQEMEALRVSIPRMPPPMTQLMVDPETGLPVAQVGPVAAAPLPTPLVAPGVSPQRMYDTAWADYTTGQFALAIQGFEAYITTFPQSELADDAQFYIGQTHYADGKFQEAVVAYDQVLVSYPDGDAAPEAAYKRGLSLDSLGDTDQAREAFTLVVDTYPDSAAATLAQQALDRLSQLER